MLKSQVFNENKNKYFSKYPEDFTPDEILLYDDLKKQSLILYPIYEKEDWLLNMALISYIKSSRDNHEASVQDIAKGVKEQMNIVS